MSRRTTGARIADVVERLERDPNIWIATAADGEPHLVPLSLAWDGERILLATPSGSPTVRNAVGSGHVRLALDSADDVVLIDGTVEVRPFADASSDLMALYVGRVGWDPTDEPGEWSLLTVSPRTVRAWNSLDEIEGRTIMRDGTWVPDVSSP
jgi:hypothetical protein